MGVTERKERDRAEMRQRILDAARDLFVEKGFEATSIRKIAQQIEYSPGTVYLYFKNKDEILFAIHVQAFNEFYQYLASELAIPDPLDRLRAMGRNYMRFVFEHPRLYDLMFIQREPMNILEKGDDWHQGNAAYGLLESTVEACIKAGYFPAGAAGVTAFNIWAATHGMAALYLRNRLQMFPSEEVHDLIRSSLEAHVLRLCVPRS